MQIPITYRAKNLDGKWMHGYFLGPVEGCHVYEIVDPSCVCGDRQEVIEDTIGFTMGHVDSKGKKIYLHDRVIVTQNSSDQTKNQMIFDDHPLPVEGVIRFDNSMHQLVFNTIDASYSLKELEGWEIKVIGTIFDVMDDEEMLPDA